jgi:hypothetical protein
VDLARDLAPPSSAAGLGQIGAEVVRHAQAVTFQLAEVAVTRALFAAILERIDRLRASPGTG